MLSIRLPSFISCLTRQSINQSIHINLSADAQNVTGTYVIMLVCRHLHNNYYACLQVLVNNALTSMVKQLCDSK